MAIVVNVYSKPACPQCEQTKNRLKHYDIDFNEIDISKDDNAREYAINLGSDQNGNGGYMAAPIVEIFDSDTGQIIDHWSMFRYDSIENLAKNLLHICS